MTLSSRNRIKLQIGSSVLVTTLLLIAAINSALTHNFVWMWIYIPFALLSFLGFVFGILSIQSSAAAQKERHS
jgi:hypothetical protein